MASERAYVPAMAAALMTADELLRVHFPDKRVELVRGVLVVREPPGFRHGRIAANLTARLVAHIGAAGAAQVVVGEAGFKLATAPDTVRGPDVAVVSRDKIPDPEPMAFPPIVPDLVVEIVSPADRPGEVLAKVADWLSAGTPLVWVIDPGHRVARVYRPDGTEQILDPEQRLDGEDVVPGFSCPIAEIL